MDIEYIKDHYYFETLTEEHDLSNFNCDSDDLNDFIKNDALDQQKEKLNLTKLCICDGQIVGFVSLLTDTIPLKNIRDEETRLNIKPQLNTENISKNKLLPAIKIGRFAVDNKYSGKGLGSHILRNVLNNIRYISRNFVGLRFVIVEGYAKAFSFYVVHNNFKNLKKDDELINNKLDKIIKQNPSQTFYLYLDILKS